MRFLNVRIVNFEDANLLKLAMQRVCLLKHILDLRRWKFFNIKNCNENLLVVSRVRAITTRNKVVSG
jgi:hypothetical protein